MSKDKPRLTLIAAALFGPFIALHPRKDGAVLHATDDRSLVRGWGRRKTVDAACGATRLKMLDAQWPPRVASLPDGVVRCRACHDATGRRRPRSTIGVR